MHKLPKRSRKGARVIFIPGNHDEFFRAFVGYKFGEVTIMARAVHRTADGRRFLVTHGDEFDTIVQYHAWLSHLGSAAYRYLITINRLVNAVRRKLGKPYWSLSGAIKRKVKKAVKFMTDFETLVVREAKHSGVDGVICGHIHQPALKNLDGLVHCNTGDWVESCTALVEHVDGRLELVHWREASERRAEPGGRSRSRVWSLTPAAICVAGMEVINDPLGTPGIFGPVRRWIARSG